MAFLLQFVLPAFPLSSARAVAPFTFSDTPRDSHVLTVHPFPPSSPCPPLPPSPPLRLFLKCRLHPRVDPHCSPPLDGARHRCRLRSGYHPRERPCLLARHTHCLQPALPGGVHASGGRRTFHEPAGERPAPLQHKWKVPAPSAAATAHRHWFMVLTAPALLSPLLHELLLLTAIYQHQSLTANTSTLGLVPPSPPLSPLSAHVPPHPSVCAH